MSIAARIGRVQWPLLVVLCVAGAITALALAVAEAGDVAPVEVVDTTYEVDGTRIEAVVVVENHTDEARCPEIRVAARDRDTRDLAEVVAEPLSGEPAIAPGAQARFEAVVTSLDQTEIDEELDDVRGYVAEDAPC